jgi:hypothetical protein
MAVCWIRATDAGADLGTLVTVNPSSNSSLRERELRKTRRLTRDASSSSVARARGVGRPRFRFSRGQRKRYVAFVLGAAGYLAGDVAGER